MVWASCPAGTPQRPCPKPSRPCSPRSPAAQVRPGDVAGAQPQVLVPRGSRANPSHLCGLLLSPPRSQDPAPSSAPQEASDGGKVAEPSGEPLPTLPLTPHSPTRCPLGCGSVLNLRSPGLSSTQPPVRPWSVSGISRPPSEGQAPPPAPWTGDWLGSSIWGRVL